MPSVTGTHEAGHAVASWALGFTQPGPVTARAHRGVYGLAMMGYPPDPESHIMAALAGDLAVDVVWDALGVWAMPDEPAPPAERERPSRLRLPTTERVDLAIALRSRTHPTDGDTAWGVARAQWPHDTAGRMRLLTERTRDLLTIHARAVHALACELDARGTLASHEWRAVVDQAQAAA